MTLSAEILAKYEPVIGLEVHAQLLTKTKIFCPCSTRFGDAPNSNTCPVCLGLPGTLPVLNKRVIEMASRASLAINCTVHEHSRFARKNYFYPDLPKGYQISQFELPLATAGHVEIEIAGAKKRIGITRLHVEEDAAKNLHEGFAQSATKAYIDYNRCGSPLAEIVSEPDMRTPEEAYAYLTTLRQILLYTGVSDCNMEEGSLRCDANVSVRLRGAEQFGTKVEIKNLNSFRFVEKAIHFEVARQVDIIESGGKVLQETRLYDPDKGETRSMRSKEEANDYRYFPDPDLLPVALDEAFIAGIRATLPELPDEKAARFVSAFGLSPYDAGVLTTSRELGNYYEAVVRELPQDPKLAANWVMGELAAALNRDGVDIGASKLGAGRVAGLLKRIADGTISGKIAKEVFEAMWAGGADADSVIAEKGLKQISDPGAIEKAIDEVMAKSPGQLADYRAGKDKLFGYFVGQVMKATGGKANPAQLNELLKKKLA